VQALPLTAINQDMKITLIKLTTLLVPIFLFGCAKEYVDIKSPCVSTYSKTQKDPCGPRKPINKWLYEEHNTYNI
jgi:hypothetical protein